ncbi:SMI1/KNR4 family protein [Duganella aceris]|uniref:SMI1/KNR4 family protein n=1 Tax=Duganella aceris TaxID=2703883 RepID=UPI001A955E00|nr:SMI1/KNR4 family protein [Duganella aceris]
MANFFSKFLKSSTTTASSISDTWLAFELWLRVHWPDGLKDLCPPATDDEIRSLETMLGAKLPHDYVEFLKVHNGQQGCAGGLFDNSEFLSTTEIIEQWKVWKDLLDSGDFEGYKSEPEAGVRDDWWNPKWIPFIHNGSGDHHCLDLAPGIDGQEGQVITMWHDMGTRAVEANSFKLWFAKYVDAVIAGKYVYSEDFGGLVDADFA